MDRGKFLMTAAAMGLPATKRITLAQTVGYPKA